MRKCICEEESDCCLECVEDKYEEIKMNGDHNDVYKIFSKLIL